MTKIIQYSKGDVRRMLVIAASIERLGNPTLLELVKFTGHNKGTIPADIEKLKEQLHVEIIKNDTRYSIRDWGDILKKNGVKKVLKG